MSIEDLSGMMFGRWYVVKQAPTRISKQNKKIRYWYCRCECGCEKEVAERSLKEGKSKSCGCYHSDIMKDVGKINKTHGMSTSRLYRIYKHMLHRCYYEKDIRYKEYGGRGISVCLDWLNSFESFRDWALKNGYNESLSIGRIDVNGNYTPDNCRWASAIEQANNRRNVKLYSYNGDTHSIAEWARILEMPYKKLWKRIHSGWDIERALTT